MTKGCNKKVLLFEYQIVLREDEKDILKTEWSSDVELVIRIAKLIRTRFPLHMRVGMKMREATETEVIV